MATAVGPLPQRAAATRYQASVTAPPTTPFTSGLRVLKDGGSNTKIGKRVQKGRWKGFPIFTLTLEERKTCWSGCQNWNYCYGDNMPFATRYEHGAALQAAITEDVKVLASRRSTKNGFVVRLHVLGDFYSVDYVQFWRTLLEQYPALHLYGYTHWRDAHPIGHAVTLLAFECGDRVAFRRSDKSELADPLPNAGTVCRGEAALSETVFCPEQTGRTASCASCGLCMGGRVSVTFTDHSRLSRPPQPAIMASVA